MNFRNLLRLTVCLVLAVSVFHLPVKSPDTYALGIKANYSITEYNIIIEPNVDDQTVKIECDVTIKPNVDLTSVNLYYDPIFKMDNIEGILEFKQNRDQLTIPVFAKAGKSFVLKLHYYALLKGIEYPGRQWNYIGREGFYLYQWWYPVTQTTITQGFSDVVTMKVQVFTPLNWLVASYDVVKKTLSQDKRQQLHILEIRDPAFYYHIVAAPFNTFEITDPKISMKASFFGTKEHETFGRKIGDEIFKELTFYEKNFGTPAPQSYIICEMPDKFKIATGEKGMLFIPSRQFTDAAKKDEEKKGLDQTGTDKKEITITDAEFLAERVAASWWGGTVYGIGQEADFLNLSLAKYSSMLYLENRDGEEKLIDQLREARKLFYEKVKPEEEVPLTTFVKEDMLDIYYKGKGPLVYHMLRQVVGDSAFYKALKNYAGRFAGKFSTLADLEAEMTKSSGKKLTWFFEQWVKQTGRMTYNIDFTLLPGEKPYRFKIRLENKSAITMPFRIDVIYSDMSSTQFEWTTETKELEKILTADKKPVGAKINRPEGYMLNDDSKVNSLLNGPINNFFYLTGNFLIVEGTLQGNEKLEKAVKDRSNLYKNIFKKEFKLDVKVVTDNQVTTDDLKNYNILAIGCTGCNRVLAFLEGKTPLSFVNYMLGQKDPFVHGDHREGTYYCPNPQNPWRGLLADEYFWSDDNYDPHNLPYDFYTRNLQLGEHAKGWFHKYNTNAWRPPVVPMITWKSAETSNAAEMFENVYNLTGTSNVDLEVTYNPKNYQVFGSKPQKLFIQKGEFDKPISVLRGSEFLNDTITIEAQTEMATYKRILRYDFRGELEPPTMSFKNPPKQVPSGQDVIIDWEARDNETFAADITFAWRIDGGEATSFAKGTRAIFKGLKSGRHTIKFYALDKRGNINYSTPTVVFDVNK